tara:strand:+ start:6864 stop:7106 length:243 start_codon:yes stop_codon:yes gene_type:complete
MRYQCNICGNTKDLYKFKLTFNERLKKLVNKEAICCNEEMECITKDEGMPTIIRNEMKHSYSESKKHVDRIMKGNNQREI